MPSPADVHEQLTDILVRVLDCPADAVVPQARLKDLGIDSLTIVEVGEELGRRFDLYLSDATIDGLVTVQDGIDAVLGHDGVTTTTALASTPAPPRDKSRTPRRGAVGGVAIWLALIGAAVGAVIGLAGAALVQASGLHAADLPPLTMPSTAATTATPSATPTTPRPTEAEAVPEPTLSAEKERVAPGERFRLSGAFPELSAGKQLQVEVRDKGGDWDDFPITPTTRDGGTFTTQLYTSRTGEREFRVADPGSGKRTPAVKVEIG